MCIHRNCINLDSRSRTAFRGTKCTAYTTTTVRPLKLLLTDTLVHRLDEGVSLKLRAVEGKHFTPLLNGYDIDRNRGGRGKGVGAREKARAHAAASRDRLCFHLLRPCFSPFLARSLASPSSFSRQFIRVYRIQRALIFPKLRQARGAAVLRRAVESPSRDSACTDPSGVESREYARLKTPGRLIRSDQRCLVYDR